MIICDVQFANNYNIYTISPSIYIITLSIFTRTILSNPALCVLGRQGNLHVVAVECLLLYCTEYLWCVMVCHEGEGGLLGFNHTDYWASAILITGLRPYCLLGFGHTDYWASAILLLRLSCLYCLLGLCPYCYWGVIRVGWIDYWGFAHTVYCTVWRPRHTILFEILTVIVISLLSNCLVFLCLPWTYWASI